MPQRSGANLRSEACSHEGWAVYNMGSLQPRIRENLNCDKEETDKQATRPRVNCSGAVADGAQEILVLPETFKFIQHIDIGERPPMHCHSLMYTKEGPRNGCCSNFGWCVHSPEKGTLELWWHIGVSRYCT